MKQEFSTPQEEYEFHYSELEKLIHEGHKATYIGRTIGITRSKARRWITKYWDNIDDDVLQKDNIKLAKSQQKQRDNLRIAKKQARESFRIENAIESYSKALFEVFSDNKLTPLTKFHKSKNNTNDSVAILHLSDVHFNEMVDMPSNKYDFRIAGIRLKLLVEKAKKIWKASGVKKVVVAMTGDMLNSDRRLDEMLSMSTNRGNATFLAVDLLQQLILDVNEDYNVSVAYVTGNEGRVKQELGWADIVATDSYDSTIFHVLKKIFEGSKGVKFINGAPCELVIECAGQNVLMLHGHGTIKGNIGKAVQQLMGRFSQIGIKLDYTIFGHIHEALISDNYARSSSLVGNNAFSEKALNLYGRASQNTYVFHQDGTREGIKIDLQVTEGEGYDIDDRLQEFNSQSYDKLHAGETVFRVVI